MLVRKQSEGYLVLHNPSNWPSLLMTSLTLSIAPCPSVNTTKMDHLNDLDDIWEACSHMPKEVDKSAFSKNLRAQLPGLRISKDAVEFLFEQASVLDGRSPVWTVTVCTWETFLSDSCH